MTAKQAMVGKAAVDGRAASQSSCPSCGKPVLAETGWCSCCSFTGADAMKMFPDPVPPLLPVFDAAGLWSRAELEGIESSVRSATRRYPQFKWRIYSVMLPPGKSLPMFGFWLLNACPYYVNETAADRAWSVLLLVDGRSGKAAVVPGYSAERCLGDGEWTKALSSMAVKWRAGRKDDAVKRFIETSLLLLDRSWKARGMVRKRRAMS